MQKIILSSRKITKCKKICLGINSFHQTFFSSGYLNFVHCCIMFVLSKNILQPNSWERHLQNVSTRFYHMFPVILFMCPFMGVYIFINGDLM